MKTDNNLISFSAKGEDTLLADVQAQKALAKMIEKFAPHDGRKLGLL